MDYAIGIDIGSTASKCVILADGKELVSKSLIPVGAGTSGPQRAISDVLENAGRKRDLESALRDAGYSIAEAKTIASGKAFRRDGDDAGRDWNSILQQLKGEEK